MRGRSTERSPSRLLALTVLVSSVVLARLADAETVTHQEALEFALEHYITARLHEALWKPELSDIDLRWLRLGATGLPLNRAFAAQLALVHGRVDLAPDIRDQVPGRHTRNAASENADEPHISEEATIGFLGQIEYGGAGWTSNVGTELRVIRECRRLRTGLHAVDNFEGVDLSSSQEALVRYSKIHRDAAIQTLIARVAAVDVYGQLAMDCVAVLRTYGIDAVKAVGDLLGDAEAVGGVTHYGHRALLDVIRDVTDSIDTDLAKRLLRDVQWDELVAGLDRTDCLVASTGSLRLQLRAILLHASTGYRSRGNKVTTNAYEKGEKLGTLGAQSFSAIRAVVARDGVFIRAFGFVRDLDEAALAVGTPVPCILRAEVIPAEAADADEGGKP